MIAGSCVFVKIARTDAEMQRFITFFLSRPLFEARSLTTQPKLDDLLLIIVACALAAYLYNAFHIAALGSNEAAGNLKLFIVVNLYIEAACILNIVIIIIRSIIIAVVSCYLYSISRTGHRHLLALSIRTINLLPGLECSTGTAHLRPIVHILQSKRWILIGSRLA